MASDLSTVTYARENGSSVLYLEGLEQGGDIGSLLLDILSFKNLERGAQLVAQEKSELGVDQYGGDSNFKKG